MIASESGNVDDVRTLMSVGVNASSVNNVSKKLDSNVFLLHLLAHHNFLPSSRRLVWTPCSLHLRTGMNTLCECYWQMTALTLICPA